MLEQSPSVVSLCAIWGEVQLPGRRYLGTAVVVEALLSGCARRCLSVCILCYIMCFYLCIVLHGVLDVLISTQQLTRFS